MSDERFDDAILDALLADDPGPVPAPLRARVAAIPEASAPARGRPSRLTSLAMPAAALAAVVVVAVVVGGTFLRGQPTASNVPSIVPSAEPSGGPTSAPSGGPSVVPSASPSPATATVAPTGPITVLPSQVTGLTPGTFAFIVQNNVSYVRSPASTGGWPTLSANSAFGGYTILELKNGHDIASYALTDAGIVWMETWYTQPAIDCANRTPCTPHEYQPISWALNLSTDDGATPTTTTRLDSGVVSRTSVEGEAASPLPPAMAAQGGRVAYAVPRLGVAGSPEASRIVVRSLPGGDIVRTIDTTGYIEQLGVFGQALFYREGQDTAGAAGTVALGDATLIAVGLDAQAPSVIEGHTADATIGDGGTGGGTRIAWTPASITGGSLRWMDLGGSTVSTIPSANSAASGWNPVVLGDGFAWLAQVQDSSGASSTVVDTWHPGFGSAREVTSLGSPDSIGVTGDMLLVNGGDIAKLGGGPTGAVPASALFGAP